MINALGTDTKFLITKFLIIEFLTTQFLITKFLIDKVPNHKASTVTKFPMLQNSYF
jgi:hypothetical protein